MTALTWDEVGKRLYETGVDHGVLYIPDENGDYEDGVAWNGLTTVTESPSGAESNPQYADNIKYLNLVSAEEFGATIEAFTYPDEFAQCDGTISPSPGLTVGQQSRKQFGLCYRTRVGNDLDGTDHGYKLHLIWGALAAPSEKAYATINDSPEAISFSWEVTTTPVQVEGASGQYKATALMTVDSTKVDADTLAELEGILYGDAGVDPRLPLPNEVIELFAGAVTDVRLAGANAPTYDAGTHVVTLPAVAGVSWTINGVDAAAGAQPAMAVGESSLVEAHADAGHRVTGDDDWVFDY
jgi:hypothetical protein